MSGRALGRELEKRAFLIAELGADRFDLEALPPNRRAWLAQTGRQQTNQALSRMAPERRLPVLAFCVEALDGTTDDAIEIYDRALGGADRAAQRKREELERRDTQATIRRFVDVALRVGRGSVSRAYFAPRHLPEAKEEAARWLTARSSGRQASAAPVAAGRARTGA